MKYYQFIIILLTAFVVIMAGCEYDGPTALYYQEQDPTLTPKVNSLEPESVAPAGVNYITIHGENFSETLGKNHVYFSYLDEDSNDVVVAGEIVDGSTTWLKVRRPNLVHDAITVKVVSDDALHFDTYGPYQIDQVMEQYGGFIENLALASMVVDEFENLYVFQQVFPYMVYEVTSDGVRTTLYQTTSLVYGGSIGPAGELVLFTNDVIINEFVITPEDTTMVKFAEVAGRVRFGDFDSNGNLYAVGRSRSDLYVVPFGDTLGIEPGLYGDTFFDLSISYDKGTEYVYVLVELREPDANNPELAIWRNQILDANGNLGARELVLDWSTTGEYAELDPNGFEVHEDADGVVLYIGTDHTNPVLMYDPDKDNGQDILYKGIIPAESKRLKWGNANYLYMIRGGDEWNILRIDMGE